MITFFSMPVTYFVWKILDSFCPVAGHNSSKHVKFQSSLSSHSQVISSLCAFFLRPSALPSYMLYSLSHMYLDALFFWTYVINLITHAKVVILLTALGPLLINNQAKSRNSIAEWRWMYKWN